MSPQQRWCGRGAAEGAGGKWRPARNRRCVVRTGSGARRAGVRSGRARVVRQLDRVKDEEPYSELYPRVCERLSDSSRVTVFGFKDISSVTAMFPPSAGCLLHTSFSLGACAIAVHITGDTSSCQMLWERQSPTEHLGKGEMSASL
ncbi:DDB1- and CUL4-associated factor 15-like [Larus michahellis]|uniref:DDB1- and CUL4-associated factor 15-like n=1 Tax=Larus michahellis TaxID=119627 RepID=UPI003D9B7C74